ncbi:hypothetical protein Taro_051188 [Colocasia esculenta]|uniref:DEUBAD domain-containing protein n=1 Tax=Colocasia esculenta TaxID=4460 RepID=A0A843XG38_COLES|nr:hypothetical protein [Colocasia esculenta]
MAAGQRKKKLNGASVIRLSSYEHNAGQKKMKRESSDIILNMTSHVSLEWDDNQNKVVAKRGQMGITWKDMAPFLDYVPEFRTGLADVLSIPQEIFGLENIADVLSYEVWETSLSEQERKLLVQFLPKGVNVDDVVPSLLAGENFHFGNPFSKGASLCAGDLHPDALLHMDQQLRATRKSYFCELRKYHSGTLNNLSKLKERWTSCRDSEKEIAAKIWREGTTKLTNRRPSVAAGKTKILAISEEQLHNTCFQDGDTSKYMFYIKINKKQHQLVKSINNFGDGIHSKCLSNVLGDINSFNIQPYEAFEEEERKRLHEYWLQLANTDLPAAFEDRRQCRLSREKWRKCVQQELEQKEMMTKDERKNPRCSPAEKVDDRDSERESPLYMQDAGRFQPIHFNDHHLLERNPSLDAHQDSPTISDQDQNLFIFKAATTDSINHSMDNHDVEKIPSLNSSDEHSPSDIDLGRNEYIVNQATISPGPSKLSKYEDAAKDMMESKSSSRIACHLERIPSLNSRSIDVHEHGDQHLINCSYNSPVIPQFLQSVTTNILEEKLPTPSPKDRWQSGSTGHSYHHYSPDCRISRSAGESAVQQPQPVRGRSSHLIDLEVQMLDREAAGSASSPLHDSNRETMFSSNANQDPSLLLPSFHMQGMSSPYPGEHMNGSKQSGLQFLVTNDGLRQPTQFPHLFHEQQFLKKSQATEKELCTQPLLNRNMQSSSKYPSQGHFLSVGLQDLTNFQSPVCSGLMGHNWFTAEHDTRNGWPGAETFSATGQQVEDVGNADGSLFSVLSECSKLASHSSFAPTSSEGFLPGRNFVGTSNPRSEGTYMYALSDANSRDAAALKMNSMPWMDFSLQNRGL